MSRADPGTANGPGFPGAVALARPALAADDYPMLNASVLSVASVVPAELEPAVQRTETVTAVAAPAAAAAPVAPLQGRALIARLEQLAQQELAQLAKRPAPGIVTLPSAVDPALAGLAWDLGLSGDDLDAAAR